MTFIIWEIIVKVAGTFMSGTEGFQRRIILLKILIYLLSYLSLLIIKYR